MFSELLVSGEVAAGLPEGYELRPLRRADFRRGYLDVLRVTGKVGAVGERAWEERFEWLRRNNETYYILVIVNEEERVVAGGTLMVERKFTNNCSLIGHIEDVAVARTEKGKKMGLRMLDALTHISKELGCIRSIVGCAEQNDAFHAQRGFVKEGIVMVLKHALPRSRSPAVINKF
ncbi:acyl-CoA N-acyltransferase [Aulographum hederae CBS 113979]|uniref:Glucosamine 6-phosphate N-acetyltransferase n=1 Tax=Aulographum hederae CBS 113979 TaxID=1176131 RepID=A0A6G1GQS1_9PEZI|nr:acyl-CoA N-acyltransferase [Aulographum hederae CBS 113979]